MNTIHSEDEDDRLFRKENHDDLDKDTHSSALRKADDDDLSKRDVSQSESFDFDSSNDQNGNGDYTPNDEGSPIKYDLANQPQLILRSSV